MIIKLITTIIIVLLYYCISNKGLRDECDKEENVAVTVAAATSSFKRTL
jgi:hypothetical protein